MSLVKTIKNLLNEEVGTICKPHASELRFALAFPNTYYVGMSNLGFQVVYRLLNEMPGVSCERVFLPNYSDLEELTRTRAQIVTMESQSTIRSFDVLAFSVSFELDYLNVLKIISLGRLDLFAAERGEDQPLVIAGGPAVTFNPEPLASFIDAFVIGEAETVLPEIIPVVANALKEGWARSQVLSALAEIEGVYVPCFYEPVYAEDGTIRNVSVTGDVPNSIRRRWVTDLDAYEPISRVWTPNTEFSDMVLAEIARGCGRRCRFCVAGHIYLPPRVRTLNSLCLWFEKLPPSRRIGLLSASVLDHPEFPDICRTLIENGRSFSVSSVRLDMLDRDFADMLCRGGQETLTVAPEAGTERLRKAIGKPLTDQQLINGASSAWEGGFRRMKLYFMVGLPTESETDIRGIIETVRVLTRSFEWKELVVSVSCFVPKPWTPFQWVPMERERELASKIHVVARGLKNLGNVRVVTESPRQAVIQAVLARGDRRLSRALPILCSGLANMKTALREAGLDLDFYIHRVREKDETLPWDHIDQGIGKNYLWRQYEMALGEGKPRDGDCAV